MEKRELPEATRAFFDSKDRQEKEYAEAILRVVNEMARMAWEVGIDIDSIRLKRNKVMLLRPELGYGGDIMYLNPPKLDKIETDFMTIRVTEANNDKLNSAPSE